MVRLPDCDAVFNRFFDPWYSPDDRQRRPFPATRPDLMEATPWIGKSATDLSPLAADGQAEIAKMIEGMLEAARGDWPTYLKVQGEPDFGWIRAFDEHYNAGQVKKLMDRSNPKKFANDFLVTCCEFGAVLAQVLRRNRPALQ